MAEEVPADRSRRGAAIRSRTRAGNPRAAPWWGGTMPHWMRGPADQGAALCKRTYACDGAAAPLPWAGPWDV